MHHEQRNGQRKPGCSPQLLSNDRMPCRPPFAFLRSLFVLSVGSDPRIVGGHRRREPAFRFGQNFSASIEKRYAEAKRLNEPPN